MFSHLANVVTGSLQSLPQDHERSDVRRDKPLSGGGGEIRPSILAQRAAQLCRDTSGADKSMFPDVGTLQLGGCSYLRKFLSHLGESQRILLTLTLHARLSVRGQALAHHVKAAVSGAGRFAVDFQIPGGRHLKQASEYEFLELPRV
jgi:hypothetical protein